MIVSMISSVSETFLLPGLQHFGMGICKAPIRTSRLAARFCGPRLNGARQSLAIDESQSRELLDDPIHSRLG